MVLAWMARRFGVVARAFHSLPSLPNRPGSHPPLGMVSGRYGGSGGVGGVPGRCSSPASWRPAAAACPAAETLADAQMRVDATFEVNAGSGLTARATKIRSHSDGPVRENVEVNMPGTDIA